MNKLDKLIHLIRSIGDRYCETQMYVWPGFDPESDDPDVFFKERGIEYDGTLFIRYPIKMTFAPIPASKLKKQERRLRASLPSDYLRLLEEFGPFHLPGKESFMLESPEQALNTTRNVWCYERTPLTVLAISWFHERSDGNSIGFIREEESFLTAVYEFDHELRWRYKGDKGEDTSVWTKRLAGSLTDFLLEYLNAPSDRT